MTQQTVSKMERVQTAVEWLLNYIERENWSLPPDVEELVKKMDKEQRKVLEDKIENLEAEIWELANQSQE